MKLTYIVLINIICSEFKIVSVVMEVATWKRILRLELFEFQTTNRLSIRKVQVKIFVE